MLGTNQAGADNTANNIAFIQADTGSTVDLLGVAGYCFDGSTWDRCRTIDGAVAAGTGNTAVSNLPTSSANQGMALVSSSAAESNKVLKASAGNLYSITITTGASAGYLMIFNATSAPIDGAVTPAYCIPVAASSGTPLKWGDFPVVFSTGITAVFSTTGCFTKTASATAAFFAQVQ